MPAPEISVVIPAFNEESRLGPTLDRVVEYFEDRGGPYEVIVVDDGSTDGTQDVARARADRNGSVRVLANEVNRGKGAAVRRGVLESLGRLVLFSDADLSTPIEEVEKLERAIADGADVAVGSRGLAASDVRVHQPWHREHMGKVFNLVVRLLRLSRFRDTQCGFKCFRGEAARRIFTFASRDGWAFDVEVLFIARKLGYAMAEVPIVWRDDPRTRVGILSAPAGMFLEILKIRFGTGWRVSRELAARRSEVAGSGQSDEAG